MCAVLIDCCLLVDACSVQNKWAVDKWLWMLKEYFDFVSDVINLLNL